MLRETRLLMLVIMAATLSFAFFLLSVSIAILVKVF
ncbi:hypothetical protein LCGC14_1153210 [marine sediment metagenome]|uniref:Uncharacterized protein n=1 Tax=marine sediment metagenome TaxID=412755 RepID=A0A0F9MI25_9ZZZZ